MSQAQVRTEGLREEATLRSSGGKPGVIKGSTAFSTRPDDDSVDCDDDELASG